MAKLTLQIGERGGREAHLYIRIGGKNCTDAAGGMGKV